jgi:hypothetical protein
MACLLNVEVRAQDSYYNNSSRYLSLIEYQSELCSPNTVR